VAYLANLNTNIFIIPLKKTNSPEFLIPGFLFYKSIAVYAAQLTLFFRRIFIY